MRFKIKRRGATRGFWESVLSQNTKKMFWEGSRPGNHAPEKKMKQHDEVQNKPVGAIQGPPRIPPNSLEAFRGDRRPGPVSGFQANKIKKL